jgi:hypothetical protein
VLSHTLAILLNVEQDSPHPRQLARLLT